MILPQLAKLYCVTIDDLFKDNSISYESYAHRLLSVYETTRNRDDFIAAEREFSSLIRSGNYTMKDLCMYGMLYQYGMWDCYSNAVRLYDRGLSMGEPEAPDTYHWIERQKILIEAQLGHHSGNITKYRESIENDPENIYGYVNLIESYYLAGQIDDALKVFLTAKEKFDDPKVLYIYGGNIYKCLKDYDKAFECLYKAAEIDNGHTHALHEIARCYEELGDYKSAYDTYLKIEKWYRDGGYTVEEASARVSAERCADMMSNAKK